jgi:hemerythrin
MALIQWNEGFSVDVAEIDKQHQTLVSMINELSDAMKQGKGKDALAKILNGLISYTATHFKTEEKYFDLYKYPGTVIHKKEHAAFVQKVSDFKDGFEKGKLSVTIEVMNFLSDWLKNHIKGTDKKYSVFFNEKGLK